MRESGVELNLTLGDPFFIMVAIIVIFLQLVLIALHITGWVKNDFMVRRLLKTFYKRLLSGTVHTENNDNSVNSVISGNGNTAKSTRARQS